MEIIIVESFDEAGDVAAGIVARAAETDPELTLGLATGSSPLSAYRALSARVDAGLDLSRASAFALDEYVGIPADHPASYHEVIRLEAVLPLRLDPARVRVLDGRAADLAVECEDYEQAIRDAGGVTVQLLGIGTDGHIGFNEPTSSLASRTRIKTLTTRTRLDNARFFDSPDEVPRHCLTQGIGTILDARKLVLVASGDHKADAVAAAVEGPLSAFVPASALQLHADATVIVDEAAASRLRLIDYYRQIAAAKPA
ncbi:glucosamine-6-phosphate deaminase [Herbiconiux flava]|uniref:Glucosamine-6-phosphate deaminase n=1 Tax=Herbiconiux flava TaxID=881268 RepID=A0A852SL16_9MICO|nr:glucosamine-6-phosphate deaminase [Herbiconiux flava]GLK16685.1 glucosamine-6-phosphate deaminase [Herbiconiux flava]